MRKPNVLLRWAWIQNLTILYCNNGSHPRWLQQFNNKEKQHEKQAKFWQAHVWF